MKRIDNADGTYTIIFDGPAEAIDDCDLRTYGDSSEFTRIREDVKYTIRLFQDDNGKLRDLTPVVTNRKPLIRQGLLLYSVKDRNGCEITVGFALRKSGVAFTIYKSLTPIYRKLVNSEPEDPEGSVRYIYKDGETIETSVNFKEANYE